MARLSKTLLLFLTLLALITISACGSTNSNNETRLTVKGCDFRNARWGDTVEEVKENASEKLEGDNSSLTGTVSVYGHNAEVTYSFVENEFFAAVYSFDIPSTDEDEYKELCKTLVEQLTVEYGEPTFAIEGSITWDSPTSMIVLQLDKEDELNISILYLQEDL